MIYFDLVPSPVGELLIAASDTGLTALYFEEKRWAPTRTDDWTRVHGSDTKAERVVRTTRSQLDEYFAGTRTTFEVPLAPDGTPFQHRVWTALRTIPFGVTRGYAQLATQLGLTNAARAVGAANGKNPISIIVPCHRVIGADGSLTGFGGGIERKRFLLLHEGALLL